MALEKFLGRLAVHQSVGSEVIAGEKEGEHSGGGQLVGIGGQIMRGKGSPWMAWTMAAPVSCRRVKSMPASSRVQPGAPSPPVKRLQTSWWGSMNSWMPYS